MAKEQVHPAGREEKNQVWDWIIIGTGVGGSTFGHALAQAGRRVLFVEKGADHRVNRQKKPGNYLESLIPHPAGRSVEDYQNTGRSHAKIWDATRNRWLKPILGSGTGGSSALFGMVMERFWKEDFESGSCHKQSDSSLPPRWPIRFDEMMPYYMEAERLFGVSSAGSDPLRNEQPFDHLSRPALSREGNRMISSFQRKGLHPYTLPLARKWGTPCPFCQSWLCHHDCKNDAAKVCLEPALQAHGASLLSKAEVLEILSERSRVTGVKVALEGQTHVIQAENVALAAGALFSPVLLLKSRSSVWPEGLANESGQVGKNLMRHYIELMGIPSRAGSTEKGDQKEIGLNDFYLHDGQKYGTLGDFGAMPPVSVIMEDLDNDVAAGLLPKFLWGMIRPFARWVLSLIVEQRRFLAFIIEDLPFQENRVEEGTNGADVKIHYSIRPSEWSRIERARALARKALGPRGILLLSNAKNSKLLAHACGTCRMGEDPTTSVVNRFNRAHGVENLYVVDSSFFPSSGGMNPALTIAANALRVARHIVETKGDSPEVKKRALHAPPVETTAPHSQKTVVDLFLERSVTHSDQTFCQFKSATGQWTSMTYRTARQHVLTLASGLNRMGLKPGEGLAIMARTRWEWVALELAALRAGAFITGIETYGSKEDIQFRLEHSGVRGLVIETADRNLLPESTVNKLDFLILLDAPDLPGDSREVTFQQLETMGTEHTEEFPLPSASDPAALLYTSGTTGTPKAMRYRHHQIIAAVEAVETTLPEVGPNDSVLCWLPLAHLFQRMISYVAISRGATMAFSGDPKNVMEAIKEIRPTVFLGVPRFFEKLHQGMETKIASVPHWVPRFFLNARLRKALGGRIRLMITGSAPTPTATLNFFQRIGLPLYEAYGVSECTLPIAMNTPGAVRLGSVGRPLVGNRVKVTKEGELCLKGPGVCEGYWNGGTAFPLDEEGFYHTGDLGRMDGDGFIHIFGRRDDVFKTSTGRKIVPTRLESVYGESPLFERVMATGRGKPFPILLVWLKEPLPTGSEINGEKVLTPEKHLEIVQEIDRLGQKLLPYERVGGFLVVAGQPDIASGTLTSSLKLRRRNVEERLTPRIKCLYNETPDQELARPPHHPSHGKKNNGERSRVLFVAEAVALSHPARLLEIARQLDPETYEIHFASDPRYRSILGTPPFTTHDIESIPPAEFDRTVARGGVFFTERVIEKYVHQERSLFEKIRPDIVVGEFRPSLGISTRLAGIPYMSILNAYYNPTANVRHILPEYGITQWIPHQMGQALYNYFRSWGYTQHGRPLDAVRRKHGLPPLKGDLRHALSDADWTLFPDLQHLFPGNTLTKNHRFMAPVSWAPQIKLPSWWDTLPTDRPVVYANFGSSGRHGVLQRVLNALSTLPVTVISATAGKQKGLTVPANAYLTDFLPGEEAARRAALVITNGGNMSGYQALAEGKPIIGLASNVDQFLNMAVLEDAGVGTLLRAGTFAPRELQKAVLTLLNLKT